ncbi:hypothetical protein BLNAU_7737 [Blattamonas nauphoetae]|uniref:Uncharacterized protein n=1 Tax=Blattamonas nauphoetae TaxID=2049346 RepID=A0ABQ9XZP0_9EUKA|nr:hypothetical protein BLNAU_8035 [Blattamonas nauphoetae]KAK2957359.1 hypothetical protein BLNAU_7737 [Blattamonas nauphoetae]
MVSTPTSIQPYRLRHLFAPVSESEIRQLGESIADVRADPFAVCPLALSASLIYDSSSSSRPPPLLPIIPFFAAIQHNPSQNTHTIALSVLQLCLASSPPTPLPKKVLLASSLSCESHIELLSGLSDESALTVDEAVVEHDDLRRKLEESKRQHDKMAGEIAKTNQVPLHLPLFIPPLIVRFHKHSQLSASPSTQRSSHDHHSCSPSSP